MKKRVLIINDFSGLSTGYAVYGREVIRRLYESGKYEIAEFAQYVGQNDPRLANVPWKVYTNTPDRNNPKEVVEYDSNLLFHFGSWKFESVCLDFHPTHILTFQDYWMNSYIDSSPFRRFFNWGWMVACDAAPQAEEWLDMYTRVDGLFTYTDWSGKVLTEQSGGRIKWLGSTSPSAEEAFKPLDKDKLRELTNIGADDIIIGTVMRNQQRKRYPELFRDFRKLLDKTKQKNLYLYCHTAYPDVSGGWDIPALIKEYALGSKVLFTYVCSNCNTVIPITFQDAVTNCPHCGQMELRLSNSENGISSDALAQIYNLFDLYIQYANSEGFGIPIVEAAACGIPIAVINYSAMEDVVAKIGGIKLEPLEYYVELETGCKRAIPSTKEFLLKIGNFVNLPKKVMREMGQETRFNFEEHYSWDRTAIKWMHFIDTVQNNADWNEPKKILYPADLTPEQDMLSNKEYSQWLIQNVLCMPDRVNTYLEHRICRDLNYNATLGGLFGQYFNENSALFVKPKYRKFSREQAYEQIRILREKMNNWENQR